MLCIQKPVLSFFPWVLVPKGKNEKPTKQMNLVKKWDLRFRRSSSMWTPTWDYKPRPQTNPGSVVIVDPGPFWSFQIKKKKTSTLKVNIFQFTVHFTHRHNISRLLWCVCRLCSCPVVDWRVLTLSWLCLGLVFFAVFQGVGQGCQSFIGVIRAAVVAHQPHSHHLEHMPITVLLGF